MNTDTNQTPWEICNLYAGFTKRICGFHVQRIKNPNTSQACVEYLDRGKLFRNRQQAEEAIAKATGGAA